MKIISVKICNILSIEDAYVTFDDTGLVLVQGWNHDTGRANGAGKTAIFNAIAFALYDKLPRKITATEILRRGCKSGYVEVLVEIGGDQYMVRRSRPKGVSFSKGGTTLDITQEGFEQILRLNYNQFIITMYAAQESSNRFLSINDTEKKQFLLQLLNLEDFKTCKTVTDIKIDQFDKQMSAFDTKIEAIDSKLEAYGESLTDETTINRAIALANGYISTFTNQLAPHQAVLKPDLSKYQKLEDDIAVKRAEFARARTRREMLHEQYRKVKNKVVPFSAAGQCTLCGSEIDHSAEETQHNKRVADCEIELSNIKTQIDLCDEALTREQSVTDLYNKLRDKKKNESKDYETASISTMDIQAKINLKQQELKQLNLKLQNNLELQNKINDLNALRVQIVNNRGNILREIELYKTIAALYSPTGAQAYILDSVIDSFNERVVEYVNILWSNLTYELKSYKENVRGDVTAKFSESLIMDGNSISIGSLSGGEFRALSLCVDFALVDVMERQFGLSMSPIILDEPFNGLDGVGRELIVELLEALSDRRSVVVIDHASETQSSFSTVLKVEKKSGISTIYKST